MFALTKGSVSMLFDTTSVGTRKGIQCKGSCFGYTVVGAARLV